MSIRFQADNDLRRIIVDVVLRRDGLDDESVLRLASEQGRILVTHDKRSMPSHLAAFVATGGTSPGVLLVIPQNAPIQDVVDTLILIWADNRPEDWVNLAAKIPLC